MTVAQDRMALVVIAAYFPRLKHWAADAQLRANRFPPIVIEELAYRIIARFLIFVSPLKLFSIR